MKKILSIILGVFLFITPMAGCEKDEGLTGIYYSEKQWLFKDDGEQETVLIISSTVAVTVLVMVSFAPRGAKAVVVAW